MIRPAQKIIEDQDAEEGIGCDSELQSDRCLLCRADSIQPVEIQIHCDAATFDDHFLKRPAMPWLWITFVVPPKALGAVACGETKSRKNGRARPVSVNFDIVVKSSGCGECG